MHIIMCYHTTSLSKNLLVPTETKQYEIQPLRHKHGKNATCKIQIQFFQGPRPKLFD